MALTDTVVTWMHLDKNTKRQWNYIGMAVFGVAGILYAAADAHCRVWWTACPPDRPLAHCGGSPLWAQGMGLQAGGGSCPGVTAQQACAFPRGKRSAGRSR